MTVLYSLVYCDVGRGADTAMRQSLEYDGGVQSGEPGPPVVTGGVQGTEPQLCCLTEDVHGKYVILVPVGHIGEHLIHGEAESHALHLLLFLIEPG